MSDAEADLLAAIQADPDDDAPRLVYADARQAEGDPHGELIALQCNARARRDLKREQAIESALLGRWSNERQGAAATGVRFERGFVAEAAVSFRPRALADALADPIWAAPRLLRLVQRATGPDLASLAPLPLRGLYLGDGGPKIPSDPSVLSSARLEEMIVPWDPEEDPPSPSRLPALRRLGLRVPGEGDGEVVRWLSSWIPRIHRLTLLSSPRLLGRLRESLSRAPGDLTEIIVLDPHLRWPDERRFWRFVASRDPTGRFSVLRLAYFVGPGGGPLPLPALGALQGVLMGGGWTRIVMELPKGSTATELRVPALRESLARHAPVEVVRLTE